MKSIVILTNDDLPAKEGLSQFFAGKIIFNCRLADKCSVAVTIINDHVNTRHKMSLSALILETVDNEMLLALINPDNAIKQLADAVLKTTKILTGRIPITIT